MNEAIRRTLVVLPIILIAGCGGRGARELVSVNVTPNAADAQSFPNGQVQLMASGTFNLPPSPVQLTSQDVMWCIGDPNGHCAGFINSGATVSPSGLAQCNSGFNGIVTVLAGQPQAPAPMPDVGTQLRIFGTAQLTCP